MIQISIVLFFIVHLIYNNGPNTPHRFQNISLKPIVSLAPVQNALLRF